MTVSKQMFSPRDLGLTIHFLHSEFSNKLHSVNRGMAPFRGFILNLEPPLWTLSHPDMTLNLWSSI